MRITNSSKKFDVQAVDRATTDGPLGEWYMVVVVGAEMASKYSDHKLSLYY